MKFTKVGLLFAMCASLCGCYPLAATWQYTEVSRTKSPNPEVEALLMSGDAGATTSTEYYLYIVPAGQRVKPGDEGENHPCLVADHLKDLKVSWKDSRLLQIQFEEARIHSFRNFWYHRAVQNFHNVVELRLVPTDPDRALPLTDKVWQ